LDEKALKVSEHGTVTTDLDELINKLIKRVLRNLNLRERRNVDNHGRARREANEEDQRSTDLASVAILGLDEAPLKTIAHEAGTAVGEKMAGLLLLVERLLSLTEEALLENSLSKRANANSGASGEDLILREKELNFKGTGYDTTSNLFDVLKDHRSRF
jgi:hypothetical protein